MPAYCSDHPLVYIGFKSNIVKRHRPLEIQELPSSRYSICKPGKACDSEIGGNKNYAIPVYDKNNIHKIKEEELVLTTDDCFDFDLIF